MPRAAQGRRCTARRGNSWPCEEARTLDTEPRGKSRTPQPPAPLARRHRLLAAIVVEAALGLAPQPARLDVFHQQRTGPVLGIGETLIQHLHDREAGIEPDEIGE